LLVPAAGRPSVVVDDSGRATAAWEETNGATVRTYTRDFDQGGISQGVPASSVPSYISEAPPAACRPGDAQVAQASALSTVFVQHNSVYGCLLARGVPVGLSGGYDDGVSYEPQSPKRMALAGALLAYAADYGGHSFESSALIVTDLRDPAGGVSRGWGIATTESAELAAIRLRANGAVAWIGCATDQAPYGALNDSCQHRGGDRKEVWVWPVRRRKPSLVDRGRIIDPRSFHLRGSKLTWRHGPKLRHARLR
jgi:hypothetical protein